MKSPVNAETNEEHRACRSLADESIHSGLTFIQEHMSISRLLLSLVTDVKWRGTSIMKDKLMAVFTPNGRDHILYGNEFAIDKVPPIEAAFLLLHETTHIRLGHPILMCKYPDRGAFNKAADIIVNDIIEPLFQIAVGADWKRQLTHTYLHGQKYFGKNCAYANLDELYTQLGGRTDIPDPIGGNIGLEMSARALMSNNEGEIPSDLGDFQAFQDEMLGEITYEDIETMGRGEDPFGNRHGGSKGLPGKGEATGNSRLEIAEARLNHRRIFTKLTGHRFGLNKHTDMGFQDSWAAEPTAFRLLSTRFMGEQLSLMDRPQPVLHVYIDVSGSVRKEEIELGLGLLKHLPKSEVLAKGFTFDVKICPIKMGSNASSIKLMTGGGTSFNTIARHLNEEKQYPNYVIVITDGGGYLDDSLVEKDLRDRWTWVITQFGCRPDVIGTTHNFDEVMSNV